MKGTAASSSVSKSSRFFAESDRLIPSPLFRAEKRLRLSFGSRRCDLMDYRGRELLAVPCLFLTSARVSRRLSRSFAPSAVAALRLARAQSGGLLAVAGDLAFGFAGRVV